MLICSLIKTYLRNGSNFVKLMKIKLDNCKQTFDYGLKDITKLDDFNQVFD